MVHKTWRPMEGHKAREVGQRFRPRCRPRCQRPRRAVRLVLLPVLTWHPRPQYLAVLQTEQGLSLTPSGLESSEAPQLAHTLGATMAGLRRHDGRLHDPLTTLVDVTLLLANALPVGNEPPALAVNRY